MKIGSNNVAEVMKQVWHALKSLVKSTPDMKADMGRVKGIIVDLIKKKKRYSGIAVQSNPLLDLPQSFIKDCNYNNGCDDGILHAITFDRPDSNYVPSFLERIDEGACVSSSDISLEEVDQLADAFISSFHNKMRLEKQQSYKRYQDMLARST
eukprot:Gb_14444 [translate_table: standard]